MQSRNRKEGFNGLVDKTNADEDREVTRPHRTTLLAQSFAHLSKQVKSRPIFPGPSLIKLTFCLAIHLLFHLHVTPDLAFDLCRHHCLPRSCIKLSLSTDQSSSREIHVVLSNMNLMLPISQA
jgi:hypothetical protein